MTLRIAPGSADATIAMAIADKTKLREIEIFIYGLSIAREAKGGQRVRHLSKLTVCGRRALDNLDGVMSECWTTPRELRSTGRWVCSSSPSCLNEFGPFEVRTEYGSTPSPERPNG